MSRFFPWVRWNLSAYIQIKRELPLVTLPKRGQKWCFLLKYPWIGCVSLTSSFAWGSWKSQSESSVALSRSCPPDAMQVMQPPQLSFPRQWSSSSCAVPLIALEMCDLPRPCRQVKQSSRSNLLTSPQALYYVLNVFLKLIQFLGVIQHLMHCLFSCRENMLTI